MKDNYSVPEKLEFKHNKDIRTIEILVDGKAIIISNDRHLELFEALVSRYNEYDSMVKTIESLQHELNWIKLKNKNTPL